MPRKHITTLLCPSSALLRTSHPHSPHAVGAIKRTPTPTHNNYDTHTHHAPHQGTTDSCMLFSTKTACIAPPHQCVTSLSRLALALHHSPQLVPQTSNYPSHTPYGPLLIPQAPSHVRTQHDHNPGRAVTRHTIRCTHPAPATIKAGTQGAHSPGPISPPPTTPPHHPPQSHTHTLPA